MAMAGKARRDNSVETILTFDRDVQSNWSVVWSTTHITDLDNATARAARMRVLGRRRLRIGSLALSALMTMHCRIAASAVTSGFFFFMVFLMLGVASLANPLRHFEVYLGQWSLSGPGRAFRIIPMLDGIGIAMCINAIVRAMCCCAISAICAVYVIHSVADAKLPFTYCRDFNLNSYEPALKEIKSLQGSRFLIGSPTEGTEHGISTIDFSQRAWRNVSFMSRRNHQTLKIRVCNETFAEKYPALYSTPAYNFFYVEVVQYRSDEGLGNFNLPLVGIMIIAWLILWSVMVIEKISYGRLIWNNVRAWLLVIPWLWTLLLAGTAASNLTLYKTLRKAFRAFGSKQVVAGVADAFQMALYIHSVSVGTELIHGKALNRFASGHIDPAFNAENVWHSCIVLMLAALHSAAAAMCALVDYVQFNILDAYDISESTLWMIPMYSKCTSLGSYSHLVTALVFGGLMVSYMTVAFVLLKTALHTIFEYRVKFVSRLFDYQSNWSVVWSTTHITDLDNATARAARMRVLGRRRLRIGSLALSALMTMHCRIAASAVTSGFFFFMVFLMLGVASLANPLRHFEVYLGQWSLSGPGRAFRIIPMLDGIGIAMCINAIVRAMCCCAISAICAVYVIHSVADAKLPFTYCRVEVVQYRSDEGLGNFNLPLVGIMIIAWLILWSVMVIEKISYGRGVADAFQMALYIHSVSVGTELIHGKALNRFASGHIDPAFNAENVWHSCIVLMLAALHSAAAAMCALVDYVQFNILDAYDISESTLWMIPMYSKCTSLGSYSHLVTALVFGGLMVSYMTVAFVLLKTALHTIFEYRVKFVLVEQVIVAILMISCMAISLLFATNGGLPLLESVDSLMTGISMPLVVLLELVSLMYVYRSHDFQSDLQVATEENTCASRVGLQWQIIPVLTAIALIMNITVIVRTELPPRSVCLAAVPVAMTILALPLRAIHNAYKYLRSPSIPST
uniref:Uncharacterized protein n=1 Tax=Heliothis virescens TaxID=7102 RepID=A0A2A4K002_HELVI